MRILCLLPLLVFASATTSPAACKATSLGVLERTNSMAMAISYSIVCFWNKLPLRKLSPDDMVSLDEFLMILLPETVETALKGSTLKVYKAFDQADAEIFVTWPRRNLISLADEFLEIMHMAMTRKLNLHGIESMANFFLGPNLEKTCFLSLYLRRQEIKRLIESESSEKEYWCKVARLLF